MQSSHTMKIVHHNIVAGLIFGKREQENRPHTVETVENIQQIYVEGMFKRLNTVVMVNGIDFLDYTLRLFATSAITLKIPKFSMLMKKIW